MADRPHASWRQEETSKTKVRQMDLAKHARLQLNADMFQRHCHMTPQSFVKLVLLLALCLQIHEQKVANSGGTMPIEHVVATGV